MLKAPIPVDEGKRLEAVRKLKILNTAPEARFDELTKTAIKRFNVAISTITVIDEDREWYKSCQGMYSTSELREISFCGHAMFSADVFIVENTLKDERFVDNPMVVGPPYVRFYAGVAIHEKESGQPIGVFCIKDTQPRTMSKEDIAFLVKLAGRAEEMLNGET